MSVVIFAGPTIDAAGVAEVLEAQVLPPAAQGDLYRAALARPTAIGLIDGYFDGVPSVWHKEILWAMDRGIAVFGSASMGALRAAELEAFGMRGVGRIFQDYRDGRIEDDDEVAVLHAPAELGFRPLSEPMVSVRATAEAAVAARVLDEAAAAALTEAAKAIHYRERTWDAVIAACGAPETFRIWLTAGAVDQKRADAVAMLRAIAGFVAAGETPAPANYRFENSHVWESLTERVAGEAAGGDGRVLEELRLDAPRYEDLRRRAALRHLALAEAERRGAEPDRRALMALMSRHREAHGLMRRPDVEAWLAANGLDIAAYEALIGERGRAEAGAEIAPAALDRHLLAELRWSGDYAGLAARAEDKAQRLGGGAEGLPPQPAVAAWYFEERLGRPIPDDLEAWALSVGLGSWQELYRLIGREYLYSRHSDGAEAPPGGEGPQRFETRETADRRD